MKRIFFPFLMTLCILGFIACGNAENSSPAPNEAPVQTEAVSLETQTEQSGELTEEEQSDKEKAAPEQTEEQSQSEDTDESTGADTIVVYFSATGTTKVVAERIAGVTNADIFELVPAEPYSDADLDWNDKNSRTTIEMNDPDVRPAIANDTVDLDGYSTVYIGYPIWWGDAPRMMSTFVEAHDFSGKTVIPFCSHGGGRFGQSLTAIAKLAPSSVIGEGLSVHYSGDSTLDDEISEWLSQNGIDEK